jgi:hypothetical protein
MGIGWGFSPLNPLPVDAALLVVGVHVPGRRLLPQLFDLCEAATVSTVVPERATATNGLPKGV